MIDDESNSKYNGGSNLKSISSCPHKIPVEYHQARSGSSHEDFVVQRNDQTRIAKPSQSQTLFQQALSMENDVNISERSSDSHNRTQFTALNFTKLASSILAGGVLLGLVIPKNPNLPSRSWQVLSSITGYTYFLAWSASFYPQIFLNNERW
jgi:hypothetical protein